MGAIVYARVSTEAQEREGTSLDTQEHACVDYAKSAGWTVTGIFRDVASDGSLERPGIEQVRHVLRDGACDVLIAYAVGRLAKEANYTGVLLDEAEQADVRLEFVTEDFDQTATGQFILATRVLFAEIKEGARA